MEAVIIPGPAGLEQPTGVVVVLDIFRASNTILALLAAGAAGVWLIKDLEQARVLKKARPHMLLWGERGGIMPPDFDGDNSPCRASRQTLTGRQVILTTSAGTQAVARLTQAQAVCFASFANASALAGYLTALAPASVSLLPMGLEAREPALEDSQAALYLRELLAGRRPDFAPIRQRLLDCPGAARLRRLGQQDDLAFCATLDSHHLVPLVSFEDFPVARQVPPGRVPPAGH
ncbi:MAG: 2-phosphosulfolactate phosphatase [Pseudomonadota bacterium]